MPTVTDFTVDFVQGFAQLLAAAGIGMSWDPEGGYAANVSGIWYPTAPEDAWRPVVLIPYELADDPVFPEATYGLQVTVRSADEDVDDVYRQLSAIGGVLTGLWPYTLPTGVRLIRQVRVAGTNPTLDDRRRWNAKKNWVWDVYRPRPA